MLRQRLPEPEPVAVATVEKLPQIHTFQTGYYSNTRDQERPIHVHEGERRLFPELRQVLSPRQRRRHQADGQGRRADRSFGGEAGGGSGGA